MALKVRTAYSHIVVISLTIPTANPPFNWNFPSPVVVVR
jgi:hypothetical protein